MKGYKSLTYDDVSYLNVYLFRLVGFCSRDKYESIIDHCSVTFFHVMMAIYWTMHVGYEIRMIANGTLEVDGIFESVVVHGLFLRYVMLQRNRSRLTELMRICEELWQHLVGDEGNTVKKFEKKVSYLMYFFFWNTIAAIVFYVITALTVKLPSATVGGKERRMLAHKYYVDVHEGPWYVFSFVLQEVVCISAAILIAAIETVGPFLIMMACGYLRVIYDRLLSMANSPDNTNIMNDNHQSLVEESFKKLSTHDVLNCVTFHQKIMVLCEKIEGFTSSLFIIQVACTVYNISLIGIKLLENDPNGLKYIPILIMNGLQLFSCQWIPEHLINESEDLANAAYMASMTHPEYERETNRMLLFMIIRAERPVQMTAGGYIKLSLETFQRMFVNAISFFTLLRNFK